MTIHSVPVVLRNSFDDFEEHVILHKWIAPQSSVLCGYVGVMITTAWHSNIKSAHEAKIVLPENGPSQCASSAVSVARRWPNHRVLLRTVASISRGTWISSRMFKSMHEQNFLVFTYYILRTIVRERLDAENSWTTVSCRFFAHFDVTNNQWQASSRWWLRLKDPLQKKKSWWSSCLSFDSFSLGERGGQRHVGGTL